MRKKAADEEMMDIDALEAAATDVFYRCSILQTSQQVQKTRYISHLSTALTCCGVTDAQEDAQEGC